MPHKKCVVVVDNSNIFIEGRKHSAREKGVNKLHPDELEPLDPSWRIDFGRLLLAISTGRVVERAILVGSRPPQNDSVWNEAENRGFDVTVHDRSYTGQEKAVDTELVAQATEIICSCAEPMDLAIISGDRDFVPLVSLVHRRKWEAEMWAFTNAFNQSGQMATSVDRICPLDKVFYKIGRYEFEWPSKRNPVRRKLKHR
jgi:uncharacterized LabA/DUF88 family protein